MNLRSFISILCIIPILTIMTGCGVRKKNLLNKLAVGMSKEEVRSRIGKPDEVQSPKMTSNGDIIEIWEYSLATVDENQFNKKLCVTIGVILLCPLLAFIPAVCMDSPYDYEIFFLKFINDYLFDWGRKSELVLRN